MSTAHKPSYMCTEIVQTLFALTPSNKPSPIGIKDVISYDSLNKHVSHACKKTFERVRDESSRNCVISFRSFRERRVINMFATNILFANKI